MHTLINSRLKNILIIASFFIAFFASIVPSTVFADACQDICDVNAAAMGRSQCFSDNCINISLPVTATEPDGMWCTYLKSNTGTSLCITQTAESRACEKINDRIFTNKGPCESQGGGALCEHIDLAIDRCVQKGSSSRVDVLDVDFWTSNLAFAPTSTLDYALLDSSVFGGSAPADLCSYTGKMFTVGIGIAGVLAVLMLVVGGFQFIAGASNPSAVSAAKERITYAVIGLLLALSSWVILNTINTDLIDGCFNPAPTGGVPPVVPPLPASPAVTTLVVNDKSICAVMDPYSNTSLREYTPYNMRAGVSLTIDGIPLSHCSVSVSFQSDIPVNQPGATVVIYSYLGKTEQRAVTLGSYDTCTSKYLLNPNLVLWDRVGDPNAIPLIMPTHVAFVPTIPPALNCP